MNPGMDADLVPLRDHPALLVGMQYGDHRRHEEGRRYAVAFQKVQNPRHAGARAVLALAELARRALGPAQGLRLVVGVEGQRNRAARPAGPGRRLERPAGPHLLHDRPPVGLLPFPGFRLVRHAGPFMLAHGRCPPLSGFAPSQHSIDGADGGCPAAVPPTGLFMPAPMARPQPRPRATPPPRDPRRRCSSAPGETS